MKRAFVTRKARSWDWSILVHEDDFIQAAKTLWASQVGKSDDEVAYAHRDFWQPRGTDIQQLIDIHEDILPEPLPEAEDVGEEEAHEEENKYFDGGSANSVPDKIVRL